MRAYHGVLQELKITPHRSLDADLQLQTNVMSYGGNGVAVSIPTSKKSEVSRSCGRPTKEGCACGCSTRKNPASLASSVTAQNGKEPDFRKMTPAQKIAYHKDRWDRILG